MTKTEMQFNLALAEVKQSQLRAEYYAKRIETGIYKQRQGTTTYGNSRPLTDQELLSDEMATMDRHIDIAEKHLEAAKTYMIMS